MADSNTVIDAYENIRDGVTVQKGMTCWRDKRKNGKPITCGNFQTWDDFLKHDGEKFCKKMCPKKPGNKRKLASKDRHQRVKEKTERMNNPTKGVRVGNMNIPFHPRKVS